jgi:hypothetical protein
MRTDGMALATTHVWNRLKKEKGKENGEGKEACENWGTFPFPFSLTRYSTSKVMWALIR